MDSEEEYVDEVGDDMDIENDYDNDDYDYEIENMGLEKRRSTENTQYNINDLLQKILM